MTFQPRHRGTPTQFKFENGKARDWFMAQCRRVIADQDQSIRDVLEEQFIEIEGKEDNQDGFMNGGFFRMHWHREGHHYYWSNPGNKESSEYMWWFEIGDSGKTRYGSRQKIKIRKDGSIHEDNLKSALTYWASRAISRKRAEDVHAVNKEEYEQLQSPGKHDSFFTVELSKSVIGRAVVKYSDATVKLGPIRDVPIDRIMDVINKMKSTVVTFDLDMKEITGKRQ